MEERLEQSQHLIYYQVSGEPGISGCKAVTVRNSCQSDIYLTKCGLVCMLNIAV